MRTNRHGNRQRVITYLVEGDSPRRELTKPAAFKQGDHVYVKNPPTVEHTRLPGYLRNRTGVVYTVYPGAYTYLTSTGPDGGGPQRRWPCHPAPACVVYGMTEPNHAITQCNRLEFVRAARSG